MLNLKCPKCGAGFDFEPVTQLTPQDFHEKELVEGSLNCTRCPECGATLNVPVKVIYRDSVRPFFLCLDPARIPEERIPEVAAKFDEWATTAALEHQVQRPVVRLVFTRQDFIEKIYLHRLGYDDRVIEFAKYQLFNEGIQGGNYNFREHHLLYDFGHQDQETMGFIIFDKKLGRPIRIISVPRQEYDALVDEIRSNPELMHELDRCFPGCLVDVDMLFEKLLSQKE